MQNEENNKFEEILSDINYHFRYLVYLKKDKDPTSGKPRRYISSIIHLDQNGDKTEIYNDDLHYQKYAKIDRESLLQLRYRKSQSAFIKSFVGDEYE